MPRGGRASVHVDGMKRVRALLRDAPDHVRDELRTLMRHGAEQILPDVRARTNRGQREHRGPHLADSWRVYATAAFGWSTSAAVGSPLVHAPIIEYAHRGKYSTLSATHGPPPRNLIPAVERHQPAIAAQVERDLGHFMDRHFGPGR